MQTSSSSCAASTDFPTLMPFVYHPSLLAGPLDYIMCLYRAVVDRF